MANEPQAEALLAEKSDAAEVAPEVAEEPAAEPAAAEPADAPAAEDVYKRQLARYVARTRGCDVDKPRNLAKSVTVE